MRSDLHQKLRECESFVRDTLIPDEKWLLSEDNTLIENLLRDRRNEVKKLNLWAPCHPEKYGGMGLTFEEYVPFSERIGMTPYGHYIFNCHAPDAGNIELLEAYGSEVQKSKWLPSLISGEVRSCFGMTEKNVAGSNPLLIKTTALRSGDNYVVNGEKWFATGADGAAVCLLMAVSEPNALDYLRASIFLVPMDSPGLKSIRKIPVMGHVGSGVMSHSELQFSDVKVAEENLLGEAGTGFVMAQKRLGPGRIQHCSRWLGIGRRALEMLCDRANRREMGYGKTLSEKQIIQTWVAETAASLQASRLMVTDVARKIDKEGSKSAQIEIGMIKFFVADVMRAALERSIQAFGADGLTDDNVLSHFYRIERGARIYDGADEVHKINVGKKVLELAKTR